MADGMSFDKYIDNPSGGASVVTQRAYFKSLYKEKFNKVLLREEGKIEYRVYYTDDKDDSWYIYMKIPSEVISNFYYDVVIRLFTTENRKKSNVKLREYAVQFFSNDPAFMYTFAHSFRENKLFIKDLESKMAKEALRSVAKVRNPKDEVWYVKSLYFAYLTIEKYNLFNRTVLKQHAKKYDKRALLSMIMYAPEKVEARQKAGEELEKKKREEKLRKRENTNPNVKVSPSSSSTKFARKSKVSNVTKNVRTTKKIGMKKPLK